MGWSTVHFQCLHGVQTVAPKQKNEVQEILAEIWGHEEIPCGQDCGYEKETVLPQGLRSLQGGDEEENIVCLQFW